MLQFIDEYRNRLFIECICKTLNIHLVGGCIAFRGYRQSKSRGTPARRLHYATLRAHIAKLHADNQGVYWICKI